MNFPDDSALLEADEPAPVAVVNPQGAASFLLLGDHAGNAVPRRLSGLGMAPADLERHIAIDIGTRALGTILADVLDAAFVHQHYSRLVVDCNRTPNHPDAMATVSDGTSVPGNRALTDTARRSRMAGIHAPYHDAIAAIIEERTARGQDTIVIALHSFTPTMGGQARPWEIGILHGLGNPAFALRMLRELRRSGLTIGDNAPYAMDDTDYTVPRHAFALGLPYAEIEVRQDLLDPVHANPAIVALLTQAMHAALGTRAPDDRP